MSEYEINSEIKMHIKPINKDLFKVHFTNYLDEIVHASKITITKWFFGISKVITIHPTANEYFLFLTDDYKVHVNNEELFCIGNGRVYYDRRKGFLL